MEKMWIFQGVVGDPGLPGRDGDAGIEVCFASEALYYTIL